LLLKVIAVIGRFLGGFAILLAIPCLLVLVVPYDFFHEATALSWVVVVSFFLGIFFGACSWIVSWLTKDKWWRNEFERTKNMSQFPTPGQDVDWWKEWLSLTTFIRRMLRDEI